MNLTISAPSINLSISMLFRMGLVDMLWKFWHELYWFSFWVDTLKLFLYSCVHFKLLLRCMFSVIILNHDMLSFFFPLLIFEQHGWACWWCYCDVDNVEINLTVNAQANLLPLGPLRFVFEELHLVWDCVHPGWGGGLCSQLIFCFILEDIFIWIPLRIIWLVVLASVKFWNGVLYHIKVVFTVSVQPLNFLWLPTTVIADVQVSYFNFKFYK
jgi:hypothetical protein